MSSTSPREETKSVAPALSRGFAILDLIARKPGLSFAEIRNQLDLPNSSCHHLISTLCQVGALQLQANRGYVLGLRLFELGSIAANQRQLDEYALPALTRLAEELRLTCHLGVMEGDEAVVAELIAKIEADFGTTPDILVNNAGVIQRTPMLDMSAEDFRRVVDIDLNAPFIVSKACLPGMIAKGHGKIINICSMMSELGRETIAGYAAAKGGLKMLTKNIASEYGKYNIQCNGIGPGYIATPQTAPLREIQPDGSRHPFDQFIVAKTPAERWGEAEDLGGPAVFLASEASDFVNGLILYVDGGILAYIGKQPG